MATYYVDSNATGLNSGTSWTDAWTTIDSATNVNAGDVILVDDSHVDAFVGNKNLNFYGGTFLNPIKIISVDKATNDYSSGATIKSAPSNYNLYINGNILFYGCTIQAGERLALPQSSDYRMWFDDCVLGTLGTGQHRYIQFGSGSGDGQSSSIIVTNSTIGDQYNNYPYRFSGHGTMHIRNCTFASTSARTLGGRGNVMFMNDDSPKVTIEDCDFSAETATTNLFGGMTMSSSFTLRRCKLQSGYSIGTLNEFSQVSLEDCESSNLTSPSINAIFADPFGVSESVSSVYRSSGASDGTTEYSFKFTSNSNALESHLPISSFSFAKYVGTGSQTITVYLAGGSSLNDDDFWIEVESPSEEASPTAQGKFRTTKPYPLATPTALASDTSSWTGTGVGTAQKVEVAIAPTIAGTVTVRCYLAKPSTTVYVDPKISTDGKQRVFDGVLVDGEATQTTSPKFHPLG